MQVRHTVLIFFNAFSWNCLRWDIQHTVPYTSKRLYTTKDCWFRHCTNQEANSELVELVYLLSSLTLCQHANAKHLGSLHNAAILWLLVSDNFLLHFSSTVGQTKVQYLHLNSPADRYTHIFVILEGIAENHIAI